MYERGMRVPMDNPLRATVETEAPRNKKGQLRLQMKAWREVGRLYSDEAGLDALPREQLLVVCPWPPWCASPGKVIFRLDELVGVTHDDDPVFMKKAFEESCADLPHADVMIWCDGAADGIQWCGSGVVIQWTGVQ